MTAKENILGKSQAEIAEMVRAAGKPSYTSGQIIDWLYHKKVRTFDEMSNLSKETRSWLNDNYSLHTGQIVRIQESEDGTKKYLIQVRPDGFIESVYIPDDERGTLCISTQIGCKMGCIFCMTGKQGYSGDLTSGEILGQILLLPEREQLTNYVFMGMGEPFSNTESVLRVLKS